MVTIIIQEYFTADYKKGYLKTPSKRDIKSFAQNLFNKHKSVSIKSEVESLMSKFGKVKYTDSNKTNPRIG